jgi:hypothetical protein
MQERKVNFTTKTWSETEKEYLKKRRSGTLVELLSFFDDKGQGTIQGVAVDNIDRTYHVVDLDDIEDMVTG